MTFFLEVLIGGLLSGVMYSLVALGFVLIFKASGVFNFAQGAMVFFAAATFVGLQAEYDVHFWLALPLALVAMVVLGLLIERVVLRPLVNQPQITLFMATIGLAFFIEGLAQMLWGSNPRALELGIQDQPLEWMMNRLNLNVSQFDLFAALVSGVLVVSLAIFFQRCAPSPTITRRRCRSAFRCSRSGRSSGRWRASSRWSPACCGARAMASASR